MAKQDDNKQDAPARAATAPTFAVYDQQRLADEMADRQRLKAEAVEYDAEAISQLMTDKEALKAKYEAENYERYTRYVAERNAIDTAIGKAGGNLPYPTSGMQPTNETMADGTPRSKLQVA